MSSLKKQKVEQWQELLPGIPDDITLNLITTRLPWRAVRKLALVSRGWQQVIQSREVYNARVRSNSTEQFIFTDFEVVLSGYSQNFDEQHLAIYSSRDRCFHSLPPLLDYLEGSLVGSALVSLDGKLYVLGGLIETEDEDDDVMHDVVLDLVVGQRQWKQVASMPVPKYGFKAAVADGKIYALGGVSCEGFAMLQVYDPKVNVWAILPTYMFDSWSNMFVESRDSSYELLTAEEGLCRFGVVLADGAKEIRRAKPSATRCKILSAGGQEKKNVQILVLCEKK